MIRPQWVDTGFFTKFIIVTFLLVGLCFLSGYIVGAAWGEEQTPCKYTVAEIDALRYVLQSRYLWGSATGPPSGEGFFSSRTYKETDMSKIIEDQIRTYMAGCIKAEDIIKEDKGEQK